MRRFLILAAVLTLACGGRDAQTVDTTVVKPDSVARLDSAVKKDSVKPPTASTIRIPSIVSVAEAQTTTRQTTIVDHRGHSPVWWLVVTVVVLAIAYLGWQFYRRRRNAPPRPPNTPSR